jgi:PAS domain S-box-containing protein|nr:MAG: histidine kinase [Actinomycetota bacterium]
MAGPSRGGAAASSASPAVSWARLALDAPDGLAVVTADGRFVQLNQAGVRLCGRPAEELIGAEAPFPLAQDDEAEPLGLFDDGSAEHVTTWSPEPGVRREFAYRVQRLSTDPSLAAVTFRDVTDERQRWRRIAAIARTAAKLASECSLPELLNALATEVRQADELAGVQILTLDETGRHLRIMGSAGFAHLPDFFDRLLDCHRRGAALRMLDAMRTGRPIVVPNRWREIQTNPGWDPLRSYLSELQWDAFASIPLKIRGTPAGVLNVFFAPGQTVTKRRLEFLRTMAEQAAIAVDYATLLQRERDEARREERQRIARDLHDSIVQQVFSISMQAKSMEVLASRGGVVPADQVRRIADEVGTLAQTVLADLRAMVHELRPRSTAELGGLEEAVRALVDSTANRTGLRFAVDIGPGLERVRGELAEDVYRIVSEAVHNVVKHADAENVTIRVRLHGDRLRASVIDDGRWGGAIGRDDDSCDLQAGYGLRAMRERAERWGGTVTIRAEEGRGTVVRLTVPLPPASPAAAAGFPLFDRVPDRRSAVLDPQERAS